MKPTRRATNHAKTERFSDLRSVGVYLDRWMMRWGSARILQFLGPHLKRFPRSPELRIEFACALGDLRRYDQAYKHSVRAIRARPNDPYFLWHHAGILYGMDRDREAIRRYEAIIRMGVRKVSRGNSKSIAWARSLINDSRYRAAMCYELLDDTTAAHRLFRQFLKELCAGATSKYTRAQIRQIASLIGARTCRVRACALVRRRAQRGRKM